MAAARPLVPVIRWRSGLKMRTRAVRLHSDRFAFSPHQQAQTIKEEKKKRYTYLCFRKYSFKKKKKKRKSCDASSRSSTFFFYTYGEFFLSEIQHNKQRIEIELQGENNVNINFFCFTKKFKTTSRH